MKKNRVIIPLIVGVVSLIGAGAYVYAKRKDVEEPKAPPLTEIKVDVIKNTLRNPDKVVENNEHNPFTPTDDDDDILERETPINNKGNPSVVY